MEADRAILAVLAGGQGRRLGGGKATVVLGGRPLICHPLAAARATGLETIVVAKADTALPPLTEEIVLDPAADAHPLHGALAALDFARRRGSPAVVLVACDMPFVAPALVEWLAGRAGAAIVEAEGRAQPLLSRLPVGGRALLARALAEGSSAREAVMATGPEVLGGTALAAFGDPARLCFNVNDGEDLRRAEEMLG